MTAWWSICKLECTRVARGRQGASARLGMFRGLGVHISCTLSEYYEEATCLTAYA